MFEKTYSRIMKFKQGLGDVRLAVMGPQGLVSLTLPLLKLVILVEKVGTKVL